MTERPLSITTQIATPTHNSPKSAVPIPIPIPISIPISTNDAHPANESVDEEPYTIKCICDYSDDDGNTIYCERCDTWQHIECFYPGHIEDASREDFDHSCTDCKPRPLDGRNATERQRVQRQNKAANQNGDKKTKRPPSKSHKKKAKPSELQVNGYSDHDGHKNGSPQDHQPNAKKPKGHRSNHSINSQVKRSPPINSRPNPHNHPISPGQTPPDQAQEPHIHIHSYSDGFMKLYDDDDTVQRTPTNSFASLSVTNKMSEWLREPEILRKDVGIKDSKNFWQYLKPFFQSLKWPELTVQRRDAVIDGKHLSWRYLTTPAPIQGGHVGELNGLIGFQNDYCKDEDNHWNEIVHPRPFIFFSPQLPLYIDTRQEGSVCRYVRRSCRPNTTLETYIASPSEYHFWLVAEGSIAANEQITLPWEFNFPKEINQYYQFLNLGEDDRGPFDSASITESDYDRITSLIDLVLSEHGGCACGLGNDCAFVRFHRNYLGRLQSQSNGVKPKKGRKPKQNHVSPTSTGHATNSRAASEGQQEGVDEDDGRSVSGSARSKPHSRDLTPLNGVGETNGAAPETSDREKRKLAMLEESFRKMDQGPPRKKKRASDGLSTNPTTTPLVATQSHQKQRKGSVASKMAISKPPATVNTSRGRQYVDASTSRRQSDSPYSAASPTATIPSPRNNSPKNTPIPSQSRHNSTTPPKVVYADSSTQTDDVENAWWKQPPARPKRSIVPLAKRLLKNRHRIQLQQEEELERSRTVEDQPAQLSPVATVETSLVQNEEQFPQSPVESRGRNASVVSSTPSVDLASAPGDVNMTDAPAIMIGNTIKPPPPPWPGQPNNVGIRAASPAQKAPDLRVQMPPIPTFSTPYMAGPLSGSVTPSSAAGALAQSPFGTVHFPSAFTGSAINGIGPHASPVRATKKLSLTEYKRRNETANTSRPQGASSPTTSPAVLQPSLSAVDEARSNGVPEASPSNDQPRRKENAHITSSSTSKLASKDSLLSEPANNTL